MPDFMSEIQFGQRVMVKFGKLSFDFARTNTQLSDRNNIVIETKMVSTRSMHRVFLPWIGFAW